MNLNDLFDEPASGDLFKNSENEGRLLLITCHEYMEEFTTSAGTGPAARADIVVLDGPDAPVEYSNSLVFGKVLTGQLRRRAGTGKPSLGRLVRGAKKPGQSPPWQLDVPSEADKQVAVRYLTSKTIKDDDGAPF